MAASFELHNTDKTKKITSSSSAIPQPTLPPFFFSLRNGSPHNTTFVTRKAIGLTDPPKASSAAKHWKWLQANVNAKSAITITLDDDPLAQVSALVDEDSKTAKEL